MNKQELQARMAALPEPPADSHPPLWDFWRHDLWRRVVSGQDPDGFMGWPCVYHTMLQNHWPEVVKHEIAEITGGMGRWMADYWASPDWLSPNDEMEHLTLRTMGSHSLDRIKFSRNLAHQYYHLWKWQKVTGRKVADLNSIVEFGGGYGAMALVARRLGFRGRYHILDMPEFNLLQEYFLSNALGDDPLISFGGSPGDVTIYPVVDLMIAGYSLSECDYILRDWFVETNPAESYLFWYSNRFEDYDNLAYFKDLAHSLPEYSWLHWRIEHMPPESWYTVGWP